MTPQDKARHLRPLIEKAAISLSDTDALDGVELFPAWEAGVWYEVDGKRIRYADKLYRARTAHTSQVGWEPPNVPALWTEVAKPGEIPVWRQPTGAQDAYMVGDKVWYPSENTTIFICTVDYNTYQPGVYGWEVFVG